MGRLRLLLFTAIIVSVMGVCNVEKVYAADGSVYLEVNYSSNITPQSGDEFELVYMVQGGTDSATITLDASNYVEETGVFELPEAYYEITSITYKGNNPDIPKEGYGVRRDFVSSKEDGSYIYISIGKSANIALEQNYEGALFVDPTNAINESLVQEREEAVNADDDVYTEDPVTETTESVDMEVTGDVSAPVNHSTEEVEVEHYSEDEKDDGASERNQSIIVKLGGIAIIALLGFGMIYMFHKMGRF